MSPHKLSGPAEELTDGELNARFMADVRRRSKELAGDQLVRLSHVMVAQRQVIEAELCINRALRLVGGK